MQQFDTSSCLLFFDPQQAPSPYSIRNDHMQSSTRNPRVNKDIHRVVTSDPYPVACDRINAFPLR
jgi:hypothetical protein